MQCRCLVYAHVPICVNILTSLGRYRRGERGWRGEGWADEKDVREVAKPACLVRIAELQHQSQSLTCSLTTTCGTCTIAQHAIMIHSSMLLLLISKSPSQITTFCTTALRHSFLQSAAAARVRALWITWQSGIANLSLLVFRQHQDACIDVSSAILGASLSHCANMLLRGASTAVKESASMLIHRVMSM